MVPSYAKQIFNCLIGLIFSIIITTAYADFSMPKWSSPGKPIIELGGAWSDFGQSQHINIVGLIGDTYTVTNQSQFNGLFGFGYVLPAIEQDKVESYVGIAAYYLGKNSLSGQVIQEDLFANLSYSYTIQNFPVYLLGRAFFNHDRLKNNQVMLDVGIGPNFMNVYGFNEQPINPSSIPNQIFSSRTSTNFSVTASAGLKLNEVSNQFPVIVGYRFFYLGDSYLNVQSSLVLDKLKTGSVYANAFYVSLFV